MTAPAASDLGFRKRPATGRGTAASRLSALFDAATARPVPGLAWDCDGSAVLAGHGLIAGHRAVAFATDPAVKGGALDARGCSRIVAAIDFAQRERLPVAGLWHSAGARLDGGAASLDGLGRVFAAITRASGRIPQISVVPGPAAGGAAYGPALTDIVVMTGNGRIFVTGPDVVRAVTGEDVDMERLGGPEPHSRHSGVAHLVVPDEQAGIAMIRRLTSLLSGAGWERDAPAVPAAAAPRELDRDLGALLPDRASRAYDVRPLVRGLLDDDGVELHASWAPNVVTTIGRLAGATAGVIANNPLRLGGCLDARAADKAARFVRMCDALGIPLVVVVDVPGYLPGVKQEQDGVVRRGAKLLHAFAEAVVPRVTLVTRKAYGGAYIAMNSRALGATAVFAWPSAEIAVMGSASAVEILHRRRLSAVPAARRQAVRQQLAAEYQRTAGGVHRAVELGLVDEVISPVHTRSKLAQALRSAGQARGAHANIPL